MEDNLKSGKTLVVVGGGAAGMFCAVNAARLDPQLQVWVLEKSSRLLAKVKVSGGGRCNVTHDCYDVEDLIQHYPRGGHFLKKSFYHFSTAATVSWYRERGVMLKTESDGRLFPVTDDSQTIIDCLMREANRYGVGIQMNASVIRMKPLPEGWELTLTDNRVIMAHAVCIACGGFPKAEQYQWLRELGHTISAPVPSLYTFNLPRHPITRLMGVSVNPAVVKIPSLRLEDQGPVLITHWGLSGPAILKLSAWGAVRLAQTNWAFTVVINWIPDYHESSLRAFFQQYRVSAAGQQVMARNPFGLPKRLWEFLVLESGIAPDQRWSTLSGTLQNRLTRHCCAYEAAVSGKTTFKEEFVTAGGISLKEIDPHTMGSRCCQGLFFAGEIMDVDGVTGGFNFQHAWTSGWIAAGAAVEYLKH